VRDSINILRGPRRFSNAASRRSRNLLSAEPSAATIYLHFYRARTCVHTAGKPSCRLHELVSISAYTRLLARLHRVRARVCVCINMRVKGTEGGSTRTGMRFHAVRRKPHQLPNVLSPERETQIDVASANCENRLARFSARCGYCELRQNTRDFSSALHRIVKFHHRSSYKPPPPLCKARARGSGYRARYRRISSEIYGIFMAFYDIAMSRSR